MTKKKEKVSRDKKTGSPASLTEVLPRIHDPLRGEFADAWVGLEPTFQSRKSVVKWNRMSETRKGEDAYYQDKYMTHTIRRIANKIRNSYRRQQEEGGAHCIFAEVELEHGADKRGQPREDLRFYWPDKKLAPLEVHVALDPETFEFGIKPVPLAWFYDQKFVDFLKKCFWDIPLSLGLSPSMAHGGAQFHLSAKTYLRGSLLADDVAYKVNHPELATWIMDYPQPDDRAFRATTKRADAFRTLLKRYWAGGFHPKAAGLLRAEHALLDRGFEPAYSPPPGLMDPALGPRGSAREIFQTNFAFGRALRLQAQNIEPGYWQEAHPQEDDYRPDQIMRYSEGNLNRLQIAGERHVKGDKVLERERVPEFSAPLDPSMLGAEASWENRAHMSRTSAQDFVEALLHEVHHAQYLQKHPHPQVKASLLQDQILGDAERTLKKYRGGRVLAKLRREARRRNLEVSLGRIKSDWIEPERLFWAAWRVLPANAKSDLANEAIGGFLDRVHHASQFDPRLSKADPMEWHRHRIHPELWAAVEKAPRSVSRKVFREWRAWKEHEKRYLARRPVWSQDKKNIPPWERN